MREIATGTTGTGTGKDIGTERREIGRDCAREKRETGKRSIYLSSYLFFGRIFTREMYLPIV